MNIYFCNDSVRLQEYILCKEYEKIPQVYSP
jgi:hypothetical protein